MTPAVRTAQMEDRLLVFEIGGSQYALPIACIVEVGEVAPLSCIPTLPLAVAGVVNHHGDALPVLQRSTLLELDEQALPEPAHILVLCARPSGGGRLGVPVDRVLGIVDGIGATARGPGPVAERRPIGERVVCVLDPQRLLERAKNAIEHPLAQGD